MPTCTNCGRSIDGPECPSCLFPAAKPPRSSRTLPLGWVLLGAGFLALLLLPVFVLANGRVRYDGSLISCKSNLKNIGTALEMYAADNQGRYPRELGDLTPNYLKIIPNCPKPQTNTYSKSYQRHAGPDAFTVFCSGHHHGNRGLSADYPQFSSNRGLIDR